MGVRFLSAMVLACAGSCFAQIPSNSGFSDKDLSHLVPPNAGHVELFPEDKIKPGMWAVAWTVFQGSEPEPIPLEILGKVYDQWGPKQDLILAKMYGKALRTYAAAGMSGSPVYIDGRLVGAISLRIGTFTTDPICGITPIALMLDVNRYDEAAVSEARAELRDMLSQLQAHTTTSGTDRMLVPISTPIAVSGITKRTLEIFQPLFANAGAAIAEGGAGSNIDSALPARDWRKALNPGQSIAAVLVSGDMAVTALGTVTYNDGRRVLAFGHPMFNLGAIDMPMAAANVVATIGSAYEPTKIGNLTEVVGALRQDRHSGIEGVLGQAAAMVPVSIRVRYFDSANTAKTERTFHFHIAVHPKWTPNLMMLTLFNSLSNLNAFSEDASYYLQGNVRVRGQEPLQLTTMQASIEAPVPTPLLLSGWFGERFTKMFLSCEPLPPVEAIDLKVDLLQGRRTAQIESVWTQDHKVNRGENVAVKVVLHPYSGERIETTLHVSIPTSISHGEHQILLSDADTVSRFRNIAGAMNRIEDLAQSIALLNSERSNNRIYVSLVDPQPEVYSDEKTLPYIPASILNVMQAGKAPNHQFVSSPETATEQFSVPFEYVITGSQSLKVEVH